MPDNFNYILVALILIVTGHIFILRWIYTDAKANGMNPWPWLILVIITSGNLIGLAVYAIVRSINLKKTGEIACSHCRAIIPAGSKYCSNCGSAIQISEKTFSKQPSKRPLVTGLILVIASILIVLASVFNNFENITTGSGMSFGSIQTKWGNTWNQSFHQLNGASEHTFNVKNANDMFTYSSEIKEGAIRFELYNDTGKLIDIIAPNTTDTLKHLQAGSKFKLRVKSDKARGKFAFKITKP